MSDVYARLKARCPQMWGQCTFDLPGPGWFGLLAGLTDTVRTYITDARAPRLKAQLYNRALRRSVRSGNGWPIYHQLWRSERADVLLMPKYEKSPIEVAEEREAVVTALLADPQYKQVEPAVRWPKIKLVCESDVLIQPLQFELSGHVDDHSDASAVRMLMLHTRNLSSRVCKYCGGHVQAEPKPNGLSIFRVRGGPASGAGVCHGCVVEVQYNDELHRAWTPDWNELMFRESDEDEG